MQKAIEDSGARKRIKHSSDTFQQPLQKLGPQEENLIPEVEKLKEAEELQKATSLADLHK